jgi:hypothetical protein
VEKLFTEAQLLQELGVLCQVVAFQVVEELAAAAGHLKKTSATVEVLAMRPQMLSQVIDARGKQGDLNFGRAGVPFRESCIGR